ncbi:MAG: hypothetical protein ACRBEE_07895 [Arenicella sp.]
MPLKVTNFKKLNVADTCSIWNILSSKVLLNAAKSSSCVFCCTAFVQYECLDKPRKKISVSDSKLQSLLKTEQSQGNFSVYHLELEDLLDVDVLQKRMDLGKGELSSIAFAKRTRQGFLTDDQGARKLASFSLQDDFIQTTPQLFGWLIYKRHLTDNDKNTVIEQHEFHERPLKKYFEEMYLRALEQKSIELSTHT